VPQNWTAFLKDFWWMAVQNFSRALRIRYERGCFIDLNVLVYHRQELRKNERTNVLFEDESNIETSRCSWLDEKQSALIGWAAGVKKRTYKDGKYILFFSSLQFFVFTLRAVLTNQRALLFNQSARSALQPISAGLFQSRFDLFHLQITHLFFHFILAWFLKSDWRKHSNLLNSHFQDYKRCIRFSKLCRSSVPPKTFSTISISNNISFSIFPLNFKIGLY